MASCSSDEPGKGQDENDGGDVKYLAVKIIPDTQQGSRAAKYELGSDTENKISKIRFYFFNEGGSAVSVKSGKTDNTYDYTVPENHPTTSGSEGDNIEKTLEAILIIDTKAGDQLPAQIVAVANPVVDAASRDLGNLRSLYADYASHANKSGSEQKFVMANSVYATTNKDGVIRAVSISADNIQDSEEKAKANAVDIHIERNVAKVRAYLSQDLTFTDNNLIQAKNKEDKAITTTTDDKTPIFIKILGWNITADTDNGYLSKHINLQWSDNLLGYTWNDFNNKRSYWADELTTAKNRYYPYVNIIAPTESSPTNKGLTLSKDKANMPCIYANENAAKSTTSKKATQIIVAAQLCNDKGEPLTICEFIGSRMAGTDTNPLKDMMLTYLRNTDYDGSKHTHYKKVGSEWKEIGREDITFVLSNSEPSKPGDTPRYPVIATLSQTGKEAQWYSFDSDAEITPVNYPTTPVEDEHVNNHLKALGEAKIWTDGYAYYHKEIEHGINGTTGVVRNHIYELQIAGFYGLGTPVYDPNNVDIIPEDPKDSDGYLAAQIYILSWALRTQKVEFGK